MPLGTSLFDPPDSSAARPSAAPARTGARVARRWRDVRRRVLRRRRTLAAACAALSVGLGLQVVRPAAPETVAVLVAAHDLGAGTRIEAADLVEAAYSPGLVPDGVAADAVGRTLAAPLRAGEPVTDVRLVGAGLTAGRPDLVALPVRLPDPDSASLLRVGDCVDLLATAPEGGTSRLLATGVPVLALPSRSSRASEGRLVVLGVEAARTGEVSAAAVAEYLGFAFCH